MSFTDWQKLRWYTLNECNWLMFLMIGVAILLYLHTKWFIIVVFLSFDVVAFACREVQFKCINCLWRPRTRSYSTSLPQRVEIGGRQSWKPVVRTALLCSKVEPEEQNSSSGPHFGRNHTKSLKDTFIRASRLKLQCLHSKEAFVPCKG